MLYQLSYTPAPRVPLQTAVADDKQAHNNGGPHRCGPPAMACLDDQNRTVSPASARSSR